MADESADYQQIFLQDVPLIDVRAPVEFNQGAFPQAVNLPLMNDQEREAVGTCYKQHGQQAALDLGHSLVTGAIRQQRLAQWQTFCQNNPNGYLYCFRGGLRSHLVQQWLQDSGIHYPLVTGGYKALRQYLLSVNQQIATMPMFVVSGNTGCGKTILINEFQQGIDLEGAARHRGSSFGRTLAGQSGQIDFENRLAISLLKRRAQGYQRWLIEDEGRIIGSNHVPLEIYQTMTESPIVVIEEPLEQRLDRLQNEYIDQMLAGFSAVHGAQEGWHQFTTYLQNGLMAIRKRLGHERHQRLLDIMTDAFQQQQAGQGSEVHRPWLALLLAEYYDPMYTYQLSRKADRIIFSGNYSEVKHYLAQQLSDE